MIRTKIVATLGPASATPQMLARIVAEGVDVVRFNLSHGEHGEHARTLAELRRVVAGQGVHVATLADLAGPKVRIGAIDPQQAHLEVGDACTIVREPIAGTATRFGTTYRGLVDDVRVGERVLIDDGAVRLLVTEHRADELVCTCTVGGLLSTRKGVNVPDSRLALSSLTDKDRADVAWLVEQGFDYAAMSFVRSPDDIRVLRSQLHDRGGDQPIIAKIETPQAVAQLDAILKETDGLLVARGDLGVEMDVARVPLLQKQMVTRARQAGKPVIVATQMLQRMVKAPVPTRAEVSDVANAVLDGADAVMLSAETAVGAYPVEAIAALNRITQEACEYEAGMMDEIGQPRHLLAERFRVACGEDRTISAVARSAALVAHDLGAKLVAAWARTGRTARWISKYRLSAPIAALTTEAGTCRRLALCYGVEPMLVEPAAAVGPTLAARLLEKLVGRFELRGGDVLVVVGDPNAPAAQPTITIQVVPSPQPETQDC